MTKAKKIITDILVVAVVGYFLAIVAMVAMQRQLMYHLTWRIEQSPAVYHLEVVHYKTADGLDLMAWYVPPKAHMPVIVLFHGNAGTIANRAPTAAYFSKQGYGFLLVEYRGYGGNPGSPSENGFYSDGRAAMRWLMQKQHIKEQDIIIYGQSIGTGPASQMAVEYKSARALVLEAPFSNMPDEACATYPWICPFKSFTLDKYDNIVKAPYFDMPTLIVDGTDDDVIPHSQGADLAAAVGAPFKKYVLIKGAGHNDLRRFGLLPLISKFLAELPHVNEKTDGRFAGLPSGIVRHRD